MPLKHETNLLQDIEEFDRFLHLIRKEKVGSYLEIGSKNGGSFWRISTTLPRASKVVSVDLPQGDLSFKNTRPNLERCVDELKHRGYNAHLFIGDSTDPQIVEKVRALGPFDLCFIDANHTVPYILKDWQNYGPLARMVAFHDVGHIDPVNKDSKKLPIEVKGVWDKIKLNYRHVEFKSGRPFNGIGVLWQSQ